LSWYISDELIEKVVIGLGPSVYNKNSELVILVARRAELETIRENFY